MDLAPIAFFAYNRPEHALRSLQALKRSRLADQSILHIFCDGAKKPEDKNRVDQVREIVKGEKWCKEAHVEFSEKNNGLAGSIIYGVSSLCAKYGKVIVLEDDLVVSPSFLEYMNAALEVYENEEQVKQVSGYMIGGQVDSDTDALFLPFTTSWGWATWERAWKQFDPDMTAYEALKKDRKLRKRFNLDGSYDFFAMIENQRAGRIDSWAIRWYVSVFMMNGLTLYPAKSLVSNAGLDGSGVHCGAAGDAGEEEFAQDFSVETYPTDIRVSPLTETVKHRIKKGSKIVDKARSIFSALFRSVI